jgi:hypothetical protein
LHYQAVQTQDFTTDEQMSFLVLLKEAGALPAWLSEIPEPADVALLPSVAFADSFERRMPMHTKAAAFLSAVSADVYNYPVHKTWQNRLKVACASYGILEEVEIAHKVLANDSYQEKEASETPNFKWALSLIPELGAEAQNYYPINNRDEVEDSGIKLARDLFQERLPGTWFVEAAENLVKAAKETGLPESLIPDTVKRLAEDRLPSPEYLSEQIERRAKQASLNDDAVEIYKEAAELALQGKEAAMDAAHVWEFADRKFGIKLTDVLASPTAAFRSGARREDVEKLAAQIVKIAGVHVPFTQLQLLSDKLVAVSLPLNTAQVLLQAKKASDGRAAAVSIQDLSEPEQLQILELLTESSNA